MGKAESSTARAARHGCAGARYTGDTMDSGAPRTALVTGASAGIGLAFAHVFAEHGFNLVLTARRADRLEALAAELAERHSIAARPLPADLADSASPARIVDELSGAGITVDALVNDAGYGLPGEYVSTTWPDQARFLQVMVMAGAELTHRLLPGMVERGYGHIINVASVAGLLPGTPAHTLYAASKAFTIKFSESLALESRSKGVNVTVVCPGFTYTEFHDVNGTRDLVNRMPRWVWLDAGRVAREGFDAVMSGRPVVVNGALYRGLTWLARHLPQTLVLNATLRQSRRYRRQ
jgi:short-subunit dehydrogenase